MPQLGIVPHTILVSADETHRGWALVQDEMLLNDREWRGSLNSFFNPPAGVIVSDKRDPLKGTICMLWIHSRRIGRRVRNGEYMRHLIDSPPN